MLSDGEIQYALTHGHINITPYVGASLQPASYDVHLGSHFVGYKWMESNIVGVLDPGGDVSEWFEDFSIQDNLVLGPGGFVLATTQERLVLDSQHAARIEGKSSLARLGLAVHITAGFVDPGFDGELTLEIYNCSPVSIRLTPGMPIAQLAFDKLAYPAKVPYAGKYQNQRGPTAAKTDVHYVDEVTEKYVVTPPPITGQDWMDRWEAQDAEQAFELDLKMSLKGFGRRAHRQQLLYRVRREMELQFGEVTVEEML